jgi:ERCC4-type nuclease
MTITVDVRERRSEVPAALTALGVPLSFVTLAVGDYAIGDRVVERKTVGDLHRSLVGERLWSQVGALRRDPRRAYLLVEGADLDTGLVPARPLRGALLKVADNGIRLLRTDSPGDTALWLSVLARQEQHRASIKPRIGRRPIVKSPVGLLSAIPGISTDQAKALITEFGSVVALASASEKDLQAVPGIGPKRAQSLLQALTQPRP